MGDRERDWVGVLLGWVYGDGWSWDVLCDLIYLIVLIFSMEKSNLPPHPLPVVEMSEDE